MKIEKNFNQPNKLEKKLDGLSGTLEMVTREVNKMRSGYKNRRKPLSEPYRFFAPILYVLMGNSSFIGRVSAKAEMDIDYLRDKIEESKFRFSEEDLEKDEKRVFKWYKSFYQALTYLQEMNYISAIELEDSVSKFTIEITPSGARALKNYGSDWRPLYFKHEVSDIAIKIDHGAYHFYSRKTGEKIGSELSVEIEDFRSHMHDLCSNAIIEIPEVKKKENLKLR